MFDAGKDPDRNHVKAGHICTRFAQIQCAGEAFCCDDPGRDRAQCEAEQTDLCTMRIYLDVMSLSAASGFDPDAALELNRFEQLASRCDPSISAFAEASEGLLSMMQGTVAAGGDCSPGVTVDAAGIAAAVVSCKNIAKTACLPQNAASWTCTVRGAVGASCFTDVNCEEGLYCPNPNSDIGTKMCSERKPKDSDCVMPNECESLYCQGGSCVAATAQSAYCLAVL